MLIIILLNTLYYMLGFEHPRDKCINEFGYVPRKTIMPATRITLEKFQKNQS